MRQSSILGLGSMAALASLASAGAVSAHSTYDVTPGSRSGAVTMDELRSYSYLKPKKLRGAGRRRRSWRGGGKARLPWYKGSRWAKRATKRGGNPAKASR